MRSMAGGEDQVIIIETDGKQEVSEDIAPPVIESQKDFVAALRASRLVGLGGAAFPTHIKFNPKNLDEVDTLIVNGAECEPFITSDHRLMLEDTEFIIKGIEATVKYLDIKNSIYRRRGKQAGRHKQAERSHREEGPLRHHRSKNAEGQVPAGSGAGNGT